MMMCNFIILSQFGQTLISQCPDCKTLNLWQHNLLLNFSPGQFNAFRRFTGGLNQAEALYPCPNGQDRLVLRTPNTDICFTFSLAEWADLLTAMEEAGRMMEIYELLDP